jgi:hypothetical protein
VRQSSSCPQTQRGGARKDRKWDIDPGSDDVWRERTEDTQQLLLLLHSFPSKTTFRERQERGHYFPHAPPNVEPKNSNPKASICPIVLCRPAQRIMVVCRFGKVKCERKRTGRRGFSLGGRVEIRRREWSRRKKRGNDCAW